MIQIITTLDALQQAALGVLAADAFYNGGASVNGNAVPIITERKGNTQQEIDLCLGQVGICALVMVPSFELHNHEIPDLSGYASLSIGIFENATINQSQQGTGIWAVALCERTVAVLHYTEHGVHVAGVAPQPTAATKFLAAPQPIAFTSPGPPLQYAVRFMAHVTLNPYYQ